jgi:hypothetical protein
VPNLTTRPESRHSTMRRAQQRASFFASIVIVDADSHVMVMMVVSNAHHLVMMMMVSYPDPDPMMMMVMMMADLHRHLCQSRRPIRLVTR